MSELSTRGWRPWAAIVAPAIVLASPVAHRVARPLPMRVGRFSTMPLHPADVLDNLHARVHAQARVPAPIAAGGVLVGIAFILTTFPQARRLGARLLASAAVGGLVVVIAARSFFGNLIAGLKIALAQPLRIDRVLIAEDEWGRRDGIAATPVVRRGRR